MEEVELLDRWRAGDRRAGDELIGRFVPMVLRYFSTRIAFEDREELVQETLTRTVAVLDGFERRSSLRSFVNGIARNVLYEFWRSHGDTLALEQELPTQDARTPGSMLDRRHRHRRLARALGRLPRPNRQILELYYWAGLRTPEIAALLDRPESTIRRHLSEARRRLKLEFER